jgi:hypothetical protein
VARNPSQQKQAFPIHCKNTHPVAELIPVTAVSNCAGAGTARTPNKNGHSRSTVKTLIIPCSLQTSKDAIDEQDKLMRPLWQLLVLFAQDDQSVTLECAECYAVLEFFNESVLMSSEDDTVPLQLVRNHVQHCPDCREHYQEQIQLMLDMLRVTPDG